MAGLNTQAVFVGGKMYKVADFPFDRIKYDGPHILRKGIAYRIITDITRGLFPYRGIIKKKEVLNRYTSPVGIYLKEIGDEEYKYQLVYPHTKKEKEEYSNLRDPNSIKYIFPLSLYLCEVIRDENGSIIEVKITVE